MIDGCSWGYLQLQCGVNNKGGSRLWTEVSKRIDLWKRQLGEMSDPGGNGRSGLSNCLRKSHGRSAVAPSLTLAVAVRTPAESAAVRHPPAPAAV